MDRICENCNKVLDNSFEFCPYCSNPLTESAKKLEETKEINSQLVLLVNLIKETKDPKTLLLLDKYVKMLKKK